MRSLHFAIADRGPTIRVGDTPDEGHITFDEDFMNFRRVCGATLIALASASASAAAEHPPTARFEISFPSSAHAGPITGRLVLVIGKTAQPEPRLTISPR